MKKKTVLKLLFITSCLVAVCSLFYNNETSTLDSLAFQKIMEYLVKDLDTPPAPNEKNLNRNCVPFIAFCGRFSGNKDLDKH